MTNQNEVFMERMELEEQRILEIVGEEHREDGINTFLCVNGTLLLRCVSIYQEIQRGTYFSQDITSIQNDNEKLYQDIVGKNYEKSLCNPDYAAKCFDRELGELICFFASLMRGAIHNAFFSQCQQLVIKMELFLQIHDELVQDESDKTKNLKNLLYYYENDYLEFFTEESLEEMLNPVDNLSTKIIMESDFDNPMYLYQYGEYVSDNEKKMAAFLQSQPVERLKAMAHTYTEGFRKGFEIAGIDLNKKKTVNIRYSIGFEPMMRQAVIMFRELGLEPCGYVRSNTRHMGIVGTPANKQYLYDHRFDDALYFNHAYGKKKTALLDQGYEKRKKAAKEYAGPACVDVFGEKLFSPESKKSSPSYSKKQQKEVLAYQNDSYLVQNKYIPRDAYSFTIIAYPIPEIGDDFEGIFDETIKVNTLDTKLYQDIQQKLIDALDQGEYVTITGRDGNHTQMTVALCDLDNPEKETKFENCLADVNIPVGEVFTSPKLKGTYGTLHVKQVYLEELFYKDFELVIEDGMVKEYNCSNFEKPEDGKAYIKENVLMNHDTLPMGEFAIGTNTTAYEMGERYQIASKLPILIAEKTGPHFAFGDTCYSMSEEIKVTNPDGKEMVGKENDCSRLRDTDMDKAYFHCHTDVTIPYKELGDIIVHTKDGKEIKLIGEGRFVLPGTEALNKGKDV